MWNFSSSVNPLSCVFSAARSLNIQTSVQSTNSSAFNLAQNLAHYFILKPRGVLSNRKYSNYLRVIYNSTVFHACLLSTWQELQAGEWW